MRTKKKSKFKSIKLKNTKYFFYKVIWEDITADGGHATAEEFQKMKPSIMITHGYLFEKNKKYVRTFASYEENDELFSDRNVIPRGCILKMEKILL